MSANPPPGWSVDVGTWGTDYDAPYLAGFTDSAILFTMTQGGATYRSLQYQPFDVSPGRAYNVEGVVRATSIAAGANVGLTIGWFDPTGTAISWVDAFNGTLPSANAEYLIGGAVVAPSNACYARLYITKSSTVAFYAYWEAVDVQPLPIGGRLRRTSNWTLDGAQSNRIPFDTWDFNWGVAWDATTRQVRVPVAGVYACDAWGYSVTPNNNGTDWVGAFYVNGALVEQSPVVGSIVGAGGANRVQLTMIRYLNGGDLVGFSAINNGTGANYIQATTLPAAEMAIYKLGD